MKAINIFPTSTAEILIMNDNEADDIMQIYLLWCFAQLLFYKREKEKYDKRLPFLSSTTSWRAGNNDIHLSESKVHRTMSRSRFF